MLLAAQVARSASSGRSCRGDSTCFLLQTLLCTQSPGQKNGKPCPLMEAMPLLPAGDMIQAYQLVLVYSQSLHQIVHLNFHNVCLIEILERLVSIGHPNTISKGVNPPWLSSPVGWGIALGGRFDPWSGHIQKSTNECITKQNNKSTYLILSLSNQSIKKNIKELSQYLLFGGFWIFTRAKSKASGHLSLVS